MANLKLIMKLMVLILLISNFYSCGFHRIELKNYEWELTFEDNFDTFDKSKWITMHDNGNRTIWSNKELQWYKDENVFSENGILKLTAKNESVYGKDVESEKQFDFTSGMICGSKNFSQAYGKWEMKVRFPFKKGYWPAFYLVPKQRPTLPEIDIFEYYGINKNSISTSLLWGVDYPNSPGAMDKENTEPFFFEKTKKIEGNFSNVWMIWSFECFPDRMIWKLNDKVVFESTEGIPTAPLYLIANVAIKDRKENNYEVDKTGLPYVMEIDYIKVYKMVPVN